MRPSESQKDPLRDVVSRLKQEHQFTIRPPKGENSRIAVPKYVMDQKRNAGNIFAVVSGDD